MSNEGNNGFQQVRPIVVQNYGVFTEYREQVAEHKRQGKRDLDLNNICKSLRQDHENYILKNGSKSKTLQQYADDCYNIALINEAHYGRARILDDKNMRESFRNSYRISNNAYFEHMKTGVVPMQVVCCEEVGLEV